MRNLHLILFFAIILSACSNSKNAVEDGYNKQLAEKLGADEYGMRMYQFVILKTGSAKIENKDSINSLFRGHLANIGRLADEGKLVIAGPFGKNEKQYRGLYIFKTKDKSETEILLQSDPAIKAGLLAAEIYPWYGSAALETYLPFHKQIEKVKP
ncbi:MAG: hypothetical protein BGN92_14435 [Sphingobacteriales bacterium 41-5]|nr:MAG: hypothetical protein BGN92_14435 [Sphingobacteriales bacterium 41-5]